MDQLDSAHEPGALWRIEHAISLRASGLDRAAHRRSEDFASDPAFRVVPVWRGQLGLTADGRLARLPLWGDRPWVFLGLSETGPVGALALGGEEPPQIEGVFFADLREHLTTLPVEDGELAATARSLLSWHRSHGFCSACGQRSQMAQGGWLRRCDACGAQHFPRTDPVVIMLVTHGNDVLIGRSPGWPEGMYSLLAGFMEPGETVENAVRREVFEETGVRVGDVDYLASQPWPFPGSLMLACRGEALSREITLDPEELEDALWISREELAEVFAGGHPRILRPRLGAIAGEIMWNFLAGRL